MTLLNEVVQSLKLGRPARIPVVPLVGIHSARLAKIGISEALHDGKKMAEAELFALNRYGYDGVFPFMDLTTEAEAMGCEISEPAEDVPSIAQPIAETPKDIKRLQIPDPWQDGRLPVFLEAVGIMSEEVGKNQAVCAYVAGPFTLASHLIGTELALKNCVRAPKVIHELLKITTETGIDYGRALLDCGALAITILEPAASLISPDFFEKFVVPNVFQIAEKIRSKGRFSILHVCRNSTAFLEKMAKTGVDGISIDAPVDIKLAKEKVGKKVCIMGNVDAVKIMLDGSAEDVKRVSEECMKKAGIGGGFILSSGCEIPRDTSAENVEAMVKVATGG